VKRLAYFSGLAGLILLTALVIHAGWPALLQAFMHAGWPLLWLVPAHLVPLALDTQAWRVLLEPVDPARRASLSFLLWVAAVREAVARLLPAAGIGGEVVGIRLSRLRIADTTAVTATVIVEVLITMVVQYLFCGLGIVLMTRIAAGMIQVWTIAAALLLSLPLPVLVYLLLRHGAVFERLEGWAKQLLGTENRFALRLDGVRLDAELHRHFRQPWRLARALAWQFAGYLIGAFETWFALKLLGHPVGVGAAIAIEALTQATRHATFIVPGGLGIQEAGVMLFAYLAGVSGDVALSLALIKRAREILFGVPALLWWHWVEARQLRQARAVPDSGISDSA
jgi:putative membrane protein